MQLPSTELVNNKRIAKFKQNITDTLAGDDLIFMRGLLEQYRLEHDVPAMEIAAALAHMTIGDQPLLLAPDKPGRSRYEDRPRPKKVKERREPRKRPTTSDPD